jgi:hypothetical protein
MGITNPWRAFYNSILMKKASKRIEYTPVLLTYLDVLGFNDRIKETERKTTEVRKTYALLRRLQDQYLSARRFVLGADDKPDYITDFRSFSDLMLRITKVKADHDTLAGFLNGELVTLANIQCDCVALSGDLLRGAIFHGDLYYDDSVTFGPALGEAYRLESETAVFPRIVIDADLLKQAKESGYVWEGDYIQRGDDGIYFVDYLFASYLDRFTWGDMEKSHDQILVAHRDMVQKKLKEVEKEKSYRKRQKVIWVAQYHNSTIQKLMRRFFKDMPQIHFDGMEIPEHLFAY